MDQEPFQLVPVDKWSELQSVMLSNWPRGLPGYNALETQYRWQEKGLDYRFKVYSLFGDPNNGFVAVNDKVYSTNIINVKVCTYVWIGCLLMNLTKQTKRIWLKLCMQIAYSLDLQTSYFLQRQNNIRFLLKRMKPLGAASVNKCIFFCIVRINET